MNNTNETAKIEGALTKAEKIKKAYEMDDIFADMLKAAKLDRWTSSVKDWSPVLQAAYRAKLQADKDIWL